MVFLLLLCSNMVKFDAAKMRETGIIPDIVPEGAADGLTGDINAEWPTQGASPLIFPEGCSALGTSNPPTTLTSDAPAEGKFYTLILSDPDAPSRASPAFREFCHMVVTNIPGGATQDLRAAGEEAVAYLGPGPPFGSGKHRYVFLLLEQKNGAKDDALKGSAAAMAEGRGGKKLFEWASGHGMVLRAVGAWEAEWDASVDAVHKGMGFAPPPELQSPGQKAAAGSGETPSWGIAELKSHEIVPDVIPEGAAEDTATVSAKWEFSDAPVLAMPAGATPEVTADAPAVGSPACVAGKHYTVVVTDPDAPSRATPAFREFVHGVFTNCPGDKDDLIAAGEEAVAYTGPGAPYGSGTHRYVVMIFEQKDGAVDSALKASAAAMAEGRGGKKTFAWASVHGMKLVATGAWETEWDASCDVVHASLGFVPPPEFQSPRQRAAAAGAAASASGGASGGAGGATSDAAARLTKDQVVAAINAAFDTISAHSDRGRTADADDSGEDVDDYDSEEDEAGPAMTTKRLEAHFKAVGNAHDVPIEQAKLLLSCIQDLAAEEAAHSLEGDVMKRAAFSGGLLAFLAQSGAPDVLAALAGDGGADFLIEQVSRTDEFSLVSLFLRDVSAALLAAMVTRKVSAAVDKVLASAELYKGALSLTSPEARDMDSSAANWPAVLLCYIAGSDDNAERAAEVINKGQCVRVIVSDWDSSLHPEDHGDPPLAGYVDTAMTALATLASKHGAAVAAALEDGDGSLAEMVGGIVSLGMWPAASKKLIAALAPHSARWTALLPSDDTAAATAASGTTEAKRDDSAASTEPTAASKSEDAAAPAAADDGEGKEASPAPAAEDSKAAETEPSATTQESKAATSETPAATQETKAEESDSKAAASEPVPAAQESKAGESEVAAAPAAASASDAPKSTGAADKPAAPVVAEPSAAPATEKPKPAEEAAPTLPAATDTSATAPAGASGGAGSGSAPAASPAAQEPSAPEVEATHEGFITKRGAKFPHTWKRRHATLTRRGLDYYAKKGGDHKGRIAVSATSTVALEGAHKGKKCFKLVTGSSQLLAHGADDADTEMWVSRIDAMIKLIKAKPRRSTMAIRASLAGKP